MKKLSIEEISLERLTPASREMSERYPIHVLLDDIRSLHNVGSIFRTADAARVSKLYLCGITGHPPRREIDKTALGAVETVPWEYSPDATEVARRLKREKIRLIALEHTDRSTPHWETEFQFPCCLMFGHEVRGVKEELLQMADGAIEIPMFGSKHSLNVSVSFGIAVYELLRAWTQQRGRTSK